MQRDDTTNADIGAPIDNVITVGLLVVSISFALYCTSLLSVDYLSKKVIFFGADHAKYIAKLEELGIRTERNKRPLFGLIVAPFFLTLVKILNISDYFAAAFVFALIGSLAVGLMFVVLQRFFCSTLNAALVCGCYALAFSNIVMFGVPESYSLTVVFMLLLFLVILEANATNAVRPATVGLVGGIVGWLNPVAMFPLGAYSLLMLRPRPSKLTLRRVITACVVGVFVNSLPALVGYSRGLQWKLHWLEKYGASVHNLTDWSAFLNTLACFFVFAVISPYDVILHYYTASDVSGYFDSSTRLAALAAWVAVFTLTLFSIFRRRDETSIIAGAILISMIPVIVFYVYFNSTECMIYTPLGLVVLFLLIGMAANHSKVASALLVIFMAILALSNMLPLYETSATLVPAEKGRLAVGSHSRSAHLSDSGVGRLSTSLGASGIGLPG